jgi:hypothetical protein
MISGPTGWQGLARYPVDLMMSIVPLKANFTSAEGII